MKNTFIQLTGPNGEFIGRLRAGALDLIDEAYQMARDQNVTKRTALSLALRAYIENAGYLIEESELAEATGQLDAVRRGEQVSVIQVMVGPERAPLLPGQPAEDKQASSMKHIPMSINTNRNQVVSIFEMERQYPSKDAQDWYDRLVGLDKHKKQLLIELEILLYPENLEDWSRKNHSNRVLKICELQRNRVPLILLEGDVGTGKTALAETIGDALARRCGEKKRVHLMKINTQIRGTGQVGEMSDLIAQAFAQAETRARELKGDPVLLLIDEADALAAARDTQQMHHEDKAGLNTVLQRLDNLRINRLPLAVIFITNRPDALDPAIRRRAALKLTFERPSDIARAEIFQTSIPELYLNKNQVEELVRLTGEREQKNGGIQFTASDITDRLLPAALREAYSQDRELQLEDVLEQARTIKPTPRMGTV